ncbi:hypothetical protein [Agromyces silvae]|uniref:hypothetical protein n=1 Tax=Agromyces silvae TaxID=3388266 RepID=UPI00280AAFDF|nr:hypothetical protein [Agromyces protaetiae]
MTKLTAPTCSHTPRRSRRPALAVAAGTVLVLGGLAQAMPANAETNGPDPADTASVDVAFEGTTEDRATVTWDQELHMWELWQPVEKQTCPDGMYLSPKRYYDSLRVPTGLEISHGWNFDADIYPVRKDDNIFGEKIGVGSGLSTISTHAGPAQTVTFVMHCVR